MAESAITPLIVAAAAGEEDMVRMLLGHRVSVGSLWQECEQRSFSSYLEWEKVAVVAKAI